ncbi:MAG: fuculose phosphate aldolase, partial [Thermoprotei archaeon]
HPPYAVTLSLLGHRRIAPLDVEGMYIIGEVPVLQFDDPVGSKEAAVGVAEALKTAKCVVVKGHGAFSAAESLVEAYHFITVLEFSSKVIYLTSLQGGLE